MKQTLRLLLLAFTLVFTLSTSSMAQNGWDWRGEIFSKEFSPRWYYAGYWDYGEYQYFGGYMFWDQTRADKFRKDYAPQGYRYTHDITDLNNNLGYSGWYETNFPDPKFDTDNDDWWESSREEETEVTARDANFPQAYQGYYFLVEMRRGGWGSYIPNSGTVNHTPAFSKHTWWSGEWDTQDYERNPHQQYYPYREKPRNGSFSEELPDESQLMKAEQERKQKRQPDVFIFVEPQPIEQFAEEVKQIVGLVKGFKLKYEIRTSSGVSIVTVHGVPQEGELIPLERAHRMLSFIPGQIEGHRLIGVAAFEMDDAGDVPERIQSKGRQVRESQR